MRYWPEPPFTVTNYPAGEFHSQISVLPESGDVIEANIRDFNGLCRVVSQDEALRRGGINATWFLPYFPFARDDRRNTNADAFELGLAIHLAGKLSVVIADPHSDVTGQLPHISQGVTVAVALERRPSLANCVFALADAGAEKKAGPWLKHFGLQSTPCGKKRDTSTGRLTEFVVHDPAAVGLRNVVIVDDICDGGGTFVGLAEKLKEHCAASVTLIVTHGLFTKGVDALLPAVDCVIAFGPTGANPPDTDNVHFIDYRELWKQGVII